MMNPAIGLGTSHMDTQRAIDDAVLDYYDALLERVFTRPLLEGVDDPQIIAYL